MREFHILNLGAGVQSTTLYLMGMRGAVHPFGCAIFADTQDEPAAVYRHLEWLMSLGGPPIIVKTAGCLGDDIVNGRRKGKSYEKWKPGRFASIPAFTTADQGATVGRTRRQCSKEYKTEVIERSIRRDILGLKPRQRVNPKEFKIHQYFGISHDERSRAFPHLRIVLGKARLRVSFPVGRTHADARKLLRMAKNVRERPA